MDETRLDRHEEIAEDEIGDDEQQVRVIPREVSRDTNLMRLAFAKEYIACGGNGTEAASRAGYKGTRASLARNAQRLLQGNDVQQYLMAHVRSQIDAREVVARLTQIARASIGDFVKIHPITGEILGFDLSTPRAQEGLPLIKKLKQNKFGWEMEIYSKLEALELIVRVLRMENQEVEKKKVLTQTIEDMPESVREPFKALLASFGGLPDDIPGLVRTEQPGAERTLGTEQEIDLEPDDDGEEEDEE